MKKTFKNFLAEISAPPDSSIQRWISQNEAQYKKVHGARWQQELYGKAWQMYKGGSSGSSSRSSTGLPAPLFARMFGFGR